MKKPLHLTVDFEARAGYVTYLRLPTGSHVKRTQRVSEDIFVDLNAEDQVIGIELLAFDDEAIGVARHFAEAHDLSFPELFSGTPLGLI